MSMVTVYEVNKNSFPDFMAQMYKKIQSGKKIRLEEIDDNALNDDEIVHITHSKKEMRAYLSSLQKK